MNNSKTYDVFETAMNNTEIEPMERVPLGMNAMEIEILKDSPMWIRFNFILNKLSVAVKEGYEKDIDWEKVNKLLTDNRGKYDFNCFEFVKSIDDVASARLNCIVSSTDIGAFRKEICKECGTEFWMSIGEVNSYERKNFEIPKRCEECRNKRNGGVLTKKRTENKRDVT